MGSLLGNNHSINLTYGDLPLLTHLPKAIRKKGLALYELCGFYSFHEIYNHSVTKLVLF